MQSLTNVTTFENPVDERTAPIIQSDGFQSLVPDYALLFFDHLYSEYVTLKSRIEDSELVDLLESLHEKRLHSRLTWADIYTFDLALIEVRPLENLIRKAYDARAKYRSIAGQKEFDEYVASKPPDLTTILIAPKAEPAENGDQPKTSKKFSPANPVLTNEQSQSREIIQRVLRADIRYLLSKFYLYYAMLPMREDLRDQLTSRAVRLTLYVLGITLAVFLVSVGGSFLGRHWIALGFTVGSVAFAGIVGGCVSMLQRIQSAPSEGDALFNLASLMNGWRGLSLSPLYGGIFASLLFILFAAGILEGSIFPKITTPGKTSVPEATQSKAAPASNAAAPVATGEQAAATTATASPEISETKETGILQVDEFLTKTGPVDGIAFALLIIWSFTAGFAERLVPDTLNRLVAKNAAIQGTNT